MLGLALPRWTEQLGIALSLMLLGIGHGLHMPVAPGATIGLVPVLTGAVAGVADVTQQLLGAPARTVGGAPHSNAPGLAPLMLLLTTASVVANVELWRRA